MSDFLIVFSFMVAGCFLDAIIAFVVCCVVYVIVYLLCLLIDSL